MVDHASVSLWTTTQLEVIMIMVTGMATDTLTDLLMSIIMAMAVSDVMTTELNMLITKMDPILKRTTTKNNQKNMVMFGSPNSPALLDTLRLTLYAI
jgi:hypothetical protein